ncbi:hypothetical protein [Rhizobium ruizarguesonis]|nr:hypothetical protein [Rhizobium ruizarguesonis]
MDEPGVAAQSVTESFAAVRFQIWTWRRNGPAGNCLPANAPEVVVRFTQPPFTLFNVIEKASGHRVRFRLGLDISIGTGARRKAPGNKIRGEAVELTALGVGHGEMTPYERLRRRHGRRPPVRLTRPGAAELARKFAEPTQDDTSTQYKPGTLGAGRNEGFRAAHRRQKQRSITCFRVSRNAINGPISNSAKR